MDSTGCQSKKESKLLEEGDIQGSEKWDMETLGNAPGF